MKTIDDFYMIDVFRCAEGRTICQYPSMLISSVNSLQLLIIYPLQTTCYCLHKINGSLCHQ